MHIQFDGLRQLAVLGGFFFAAFGTQDFKCVGQRIIDVDQSSFITYQLEFRF